MGNKGMGIILVVILCLCGMLLGTPMAAAIQVNLFDTGAASASPRAGQDLSARSGWQKVPEDQTEHAFRGDAVLLNDKLAVVLRRNAAGAEVYSVGVKSFTPRAVLAPAGASGDARLASWTIVENTPSIAIVDAAFETADGKPLALRYELAMGQVFVKVEARSGAQALRIEAPCRFVVLPDFFADDMVIDAREIPVDRAELPAENFLLQALPSRDAIVMSVTNGREDARIVLAGQGEERAIRCGEIRYGKDRKAWVAVIEGPRVWHLQQVAKKDAGKIIPLGWKQPYPAQWRVDWRQSDRLSGSWEMIVEQRDGEFMKHGLFGDPSSIGRDRSRWTTVLGRFAYPCWIDREGRGHFQPFGRAGFEGPALIYPISRTKATPLDTFTVVDIVRATLGVGPCEYVLDVEGQGQSYKGRATCGTRDLLNPIYAAKKQKEKRAEIEQALDAVMVFVKHIRGRIESYRAFGEKTLAYVAEQRQAHPELADFLAEMESLTRTIEARVEKRRAQIQTPDYVAALTEKFRKELVDYEGDDALQRCKAITGAIVVVGGNQDELVGECRMAVKNLRQRAGLALAVDPRAAPIANEIRRRTQEALRNPTSYEAARH